MKTPEWLRRPCDREAEPTPCSLGSWRAALRQFAESRGHSVLELALSWLARRPAVASVIAGATTSEQVLANVRATAWQLTHADVAEIDAIVSRGPAARAK